MGDFAWVGVVSSLALLVYYLTLLRAGLARGRFKVAAPAHTGPPEYERYVRTHQNTLEHLALFLPGLWSFALAVDPLWAAGLGVFWLVGRLWYAFAYPAAAERRVPGLLMSMPPIYVFVLGSLIGFGFKALHVHV